MLDLRRVPAARRAGARVPRDARELAAWNPVPCDPQGNPVITNANDPRLKEWLANDPRLEDSKVELTFANMAAVGCQPSVQSPDLLSGGKLAVGSVGGDALGAYSKSK